MVFRRALAFLAVVCVTVGAYLAWNYAEERLPPPQTVTPAEKLSLDRLIPPELNELAGKVFIRSQDGRQVREEEPVVYESSAGDANFGRITDAELAGLSVQTRRTLEYHYNHGLVLFHKGDPAGAIGEFRRIHAIDAQGVYGRRAYIQLGIIHDQKGAFEEAIRNFKNAADLDPADAVAAHNLGLAYLHAGLRAEAISWLQKAASLDGANPAILQNLGNAYVAAQQAENAKRQYREALKIAPDNPEIHYNIGLQLYKERDFAAATGHFEAAARAFEEGRRAKALAFSGLSAYHQGRFDEAAAQFRDAAALAGDAVDYRFNQAVALARAGLLSEASRIFSEIVARVPRDGQAWFGLGGARYLVRDVDGALAAYRRGLEIDSAASGPLFTVGYIHLERGELDAAEEAFDRVVESGGVESARAHVNLGLIHERRGDLDAAAREYRLGDLADPRTHYNLGLVLRKLGDTVRAVESFQKALEIEERSPEKNSIFLYGSALADAHMALGRLDSAIEAYKKALEHVGEARSRSDRFEVLIRLTQLYLMKEQLPRAEETSARALAEAATNAERARAHLSMAILEGRKGDIAAAENHLVEARREDPANHDVYYNFGVVRARQLDYDGAVDALQVAIRLKPDYAEAYTQLGNIYYKRGLEDEAARAYEKAVAIDSSQIEAAFNLRAARAAQP